MMEKFSRNECDQTERERMDCLECAADDTTYGVSSPVISLQERIRRSGEGLSIEGHRGVIE